MKNANQIPAKRRQTYLVRSPTGMFWVVLTRTSRSYLRTGVFMVENNKPSEMANTAPIPTFGYRVKLVDLEGKIRPCRRVKWVGLSSLLGEDIRGGNRGTDETRHNYSTVKCVSGNLELSWFRYPRPTN